MYKVLFTLFSFISLSSFGQNNYKSLSEEILIDSSTNTKYVLDSSQTNITAFNSCGDRLWKAELYYMEPGDNFKGSSLRFQNYLEKNTNVTRINKKIILIDIGLCVGEINTETGFYYTGNCD